MSFRSDPVVLPLAVFSERRTRVATGLREHDRRDVAVQRPLAAVAVIVARGRAPAAATEECK
jgi:hypothetical protein